MYVRHYVANGGGSDAASYYSLIALPFFFYYYYYYYYLRAILFESGAIDCSLFFDFYSKESDRNLLFST